MNHRLFFKLGAIFFVGLLLLLPVGLIRELVEEREQRRDAVVADIASTTAHAQTLTGPLLIVPYTRKVRSVEEREGYPPRVIETEVEGQLTFSPSELELNGTLELAERRRGIYRARVFDADSRITGSFELLPSYGVTSDLADYSFGTPALALGISDIRGIDSALELRVDDERVRFEPGTTTPVLAAGVHAKLPALDGASPRRLRYAIALSLRGTGEFRVTPVGRESRVRLSSSWPHPSFVGALSPIEREVGEGGFEARWQTSFFATDLENVVSACAAAPRGAACDELGGRHFGVSFIDPVDHYLKSERASKYAFLFIGLTFAACFLLEVLRRLQVHPIQYGLVGSALAAFVLLLLSLSEHLGFAAAYALAAAACVALNAYYVAHVAGDPKLGFAFGGALGALYGLLYAILSAEDYALLIGSLLVFGMLGAIMVLTRKVDWARFGQPDEPRALSPEPRAPAAR